jgi:hypothetical protein
MNALYSTDFEKSVEFFAVSPEKSADGGACSGFFGGFVHRVLKVCGHFYVFRETAVGPPQCPLPGRGWPEGPGEEFGQKPESQYTLTDLHLVYP